MKRQIGILVIFLSSLFSNVGAKEAMSEAYLDSLYQIAFNALDSDIHKAVEQGRIYLKSASLAEDDYSLAYAFDVYGLALYYNNQIDSSIYYVDQAIELFKEIENLEGLSTALYNKSLMVEYFGKYNYAITLLNKTRRIDIARGSKDESNIFYYHRLSDLLYLQDRFDEALSYEHLSLNAFKSSGEYHDYMKPRIFLNMAWLYAEMDVFQVADYYAKKSYALSFKNKEISSRIGSLQVLAWIASKQEKHKEAVNLARSALDLSFKYNESSEILFSRASLASYLKDIKGAEAEEAKHWSEIESTLKRLKDYEKDFSILLDIYSYHKREKNFPRALEYLEEYRRIKEKLEILDIREVQANFEKELAENEKARMQVKAELREKDNALKNIVIVSISIILAVLSIVLIISTKSRKKILSLNKSLHVSHKDLSKKEEELRSSFKKLENNYKEINELNNSKDRLLSILSHDLKQPFNQIVAVLDLVDQDVLNPAERREIVSDLKASVEETSSMVNNLLQWSKSQFEGTKTNPELVNLNTLVKRVSLELSVLLKKKSIYIDLAIDEEMHVTGDIEQLSSIFRNLLSNAYKFSESNSVINISSTISVDEKYALLHIRDTGIGMSEQQIEKLLSNDKKTSLPGTNNELGTGIGMMIVQDFIEQNGGYIKITSEIGKGSTFTVALPYDIKNSLQVYQ